MRMYIYSNSVADANIYQRIGRGTIARRLDIRSFWRIQHHGCHNICDHGFDFWAMGTARALHWRSLPVLFHAWTWNWELSKPDTCVCW